MSVLKEKVAYLKGLISGIDLNDVQNQHKVLNGVIEALDEFAEEVERLDYMQTRMQEQVDTIDEDLGAMEDEFYEGEEEDDEIIDITCPHCEETISFSEAELSESDEVECPVCHKTFEIEWDCDCGCGCEDCNDDE